MARFGTSVDRHGRFVGIQFMCPGCKRVHALYTQDTPAEWTGPRWQFNHDLDKPVLSPSILARWDNSKGPRVCHSFVGCNGAQPGEIIFLGDCTHELAGKTVPLLEWKGFDSDNYEEFK